MSRQRVSLCCVRRLFGFDGYYEEHSDDSFDEPAAHAPTSEDSAGEERRGQENREQMDEGEDAEDICQQESIAMDLREDCAPARKKPAAHAPASKRPAAHVATKRAPTRTAKTNTVKKPAAKKRAIAKHG
jgi:hypothetical protein